MGKFEPVISRTGAAIATQLPIPTIKRFFYNTVASTGLSAIIVLCMCCILSTVCSTHFLLWNMECTLLYYVLRLTFNDPFNSRWSVLVQAVNMKHCKNTFIETIEIEINLI